MFSEDMVARIESVEEEMDDEEEVGNMDWMRDRTRRRWRWEGEVVVVGG